MLNKKKKLFLSKILLFVKVNIFENVPINLFLNNLKKLKYFFKIYFFKKFIF